jgi:hypothetical protein
MFQGPESKRWEVEMKKIAAVLVMICFVLTVSGLSFAQTPSTTAQEKASDNASFNREGAKPTPKPNTDKVKAEKEKAAKEKGGNQKAAKEKVEKEGATPQKAGKGTVKTEKGKMNPHVEEVKNQ